ncbi:hypothetical protein L596_028409 [Steinernema carpocapsae]|uniref:Uncharacterized protein n=1 Tax=Steinernema carpocapsae TaxID=34508 RepID=A0A4U5LYG3_STECR|nr:hypothetical protein L596_028409 [Steinernema carpocapsae]
MRLTRILAKSENLALFKEINYWGSKGKWDSVNNCPKMFLSKRERIAVQGTHEKLKQNSDVFDSSPKGQLSKLAFRVALFVGILITVPKIYELTVPETYRMKYKYREQHHNEEHH